MLNDTLYMPYADRTIDADGIQVPNGNISLTNGTYLDFTTPREIGFDITASLGAPGGGCGTGCTGIDNAFILDRPIYSGPHDPGLEVLRMSSPVTGIQLSVESNQQGIQLYSCNGENGTIAAKESQQHNGTYGTFYGKYGCLVIETQDWIDAINYPQWGRDMWQIFSPTSEPYVSYSKFQFSIKK